MPALTSVLRIHGSQLAQVHSGLSPADPDLTGTSGRPLEFQKYSAQHGLKSAWVWWLRSSVTHHPPGFRLLTHLFSARFKVHSLGGQGREAIWEWFCQGWAHRAFQWLHCVWKSWPASFPQNLLNYRILMLGVSLRPPLSTRKQESLPPYAGEGNKSRDEGTCPRAHSKLSGAPLASLAMMDLVFSLLSNTATCLF